MKISHKITNVAGKDYVYIYVTVDDIYEFGKENLGKGENSNFLNKLKAYVNKNIVNPKNAAMVVVINGIIIGSLTFGALSQNKIENVDVKDNISQVRVYDQTEENLKLQEVTDELKQDKAQETKQENNQTSKESVVQNIKKQNEQKNIVTNKKVEQKTNAKQVSSKTNSKTAVTTSSKASKSTNNTSKTVTNSNTKVTKSNAKVTSKEKTTETNKTPSAKVETTKKESTSKPKIETIQSGITIKLNNGGVVTSIDLEEYIIGVVAAEMPASFNIEALKAQSVAARTYAMKRHSKGLTLVNSTSNQVYNTVDQMKAKWGADFNKYYEKIKSAVEATKGQVLKYNGQYIDALFYAVSNGHSELPLYVWDSSYPYLQAVSSVWDEDISAGNYSVTMSYETLSSNLGVSVNKSSEIKILSRTEGDRVNEISIAGKTFTGVKVRSLLGLRSADFTITKNDNGVTIKTKGYGHGVGMSQYGANGAAKAGYTYKQILSHYYPNTSLVNI